MSVWPKALQPLAPLAGSEGRLVSISISVDPRRLESILDALAQIPFPINPQIYHDAALVYRYEDGRERTEDITLVEFPAYDSRLDEVRGTLTAFGFDPECVYVAGMMDDIHSDRVVEAPPAGSPFVSRVRLRHKPAIVQ